MVVNQVPITDQILKLTILMMQKKNILTKVVRVFRLNQGWLYFCKGMLYF